MRASPASRVSLVTLLTCDGTPAGDHDHQRERPVSVQRPHTRLLQGAVRDAGGFTADPCQSWGNDATDSDSVGGVSGNYTLTAGDTNLTVDAGFYKLASLGDFVWKDINANGIQDAGEAGHCGRHRDAADVRRNADRRRPRTNASGLYLFTNLTPGCYKVQFATPAGLHAEPGERRRRCERQRRGRRRHRQLHAGVRSDQPDRGRRLLRSAGTCLRPHLQLDAVTRGVRHRRQHPHVYRRWRLREGERVQSRR